MFRPEHYIHSPATWTLLTRLVVAIYFSIFIISICGVRFRKCCSDFGLYLFDLLRKEAQRRRPEIKPAKNPSKKLTNFDRQVTRQMAQSACKSVKSKSIEADETNWS